MLTNDDITEGKLKVSHISDDEPAKKKIKIDLNDMSCSSHGPVSSEVLSTGDSNSNNESSGHLSKRQLKKLKKKEKWLAYKPIKR